MNILTNRRYDELKLCGRSRIHALNMWQQLNRTSPCHCPGPAGACTTHSAGALSPPASPPRSCTTEPCRCQSRRASCPNFPTSSHLANRTLHIASKCPGCDHLLVALEVACTRRASASGQNSTNISLRGDGLHATIAMGRNKWCS